MLILSIRSDAAITELALYDQDKLIDELKFESKRELADKIHLKIDELLNKNKYELNDLKGLIAYEGPGSFTGLRIGLSVANTLAYGLDIPICGAEHENWPADALENILSGHNEKSIMPFYGSEPNITKPKK